MSLATVLQHIKSSSHTQKEKGSRFERLIRSYFLQDKTLNTEGIASVWLWENFPARADLGGDDLGIDLVAEPMAANTGPFSANFTLKIPALTKKPLIPFSPIPAENSLIL